MAPGADGATTAPSLGAGEARLFGVVDGDTIDVQWRPVGAIRQRVRLAYVDTPEQGEAGYDSATAFVRELLADRPIRLEFDVPGEPAYGRYGRLLAYVFVRLPSGREVLVKEALIRHGHSDHVTQYGLGRLADRLAAAERGR